MRPAAGPGTTLQASCVALEGRGLLILGPSGSGKSSLALQLLALGCGLVADDRTILTRQGPRLVAECPAPILGRIEARGVGILKARSAGPAPVVAVVDMGVTESDRLPPERQRVILGLSLPALQKVDSPAFPAALLHYLRAGLAT